MKRNIVCWFLFSLCLVLHAEQNTITVPAGTPLCSDPQMTQLVLLTAVPVTVTVDEKRLLYWGIQPLIRKTEAFAFTIPGRGQVWFSPQISWNNERLDFAPVKLALPLKIGACLLLFGIVLMYLKWKTKRIFLVYPGIVFLCWGFLLYMIGQTGNIILSPLDESSYFDIAEDILNGDFSGPWRYPMGFPIICIPLLLFLPKPHALIDFLTSFSCINGFFILPISMILCYEIFRKLSKKSFPAAIPILCFLFMAFFYVFHYLWDDSVDKIRSSCACFVIPDWSDLLPIYHRIIWFGYNALSDLPSFCLMSLIIFLTLSLKRPLVITAVLFAFSILVRIPNIVLAPFILVLLLDKYPDIFLDRRKCLKFLLTGFVFFLLGISAQLWINTLHFGRPWIPPYILHENLQKHHYFCSGLFSSIPFLFSANYLFIVFGLSSIFVLKSVRIRFFLSALLVPLLTFFCFYSETSNNGIRFILISFPFLLFAFFLFLHETVLCSQYRKWLVSLIVFSAVFVAPCRLGEARALPFSLEVFSWGENVSLLIQFVTVILWTVSIFLMRKEKRIRTFLVICGIAYFSGSPYVAVLLLPLSAFFALKDAVRLIRYRYSRKNVENGLSELEETVSEVKVEM